MGRNDRLPLAASNAAGGILENVIQIQVLPFGVLKDWLGAETATVELREGATVAELLVQMSAKLGGRQLKGIAVSVNAEYAQPGHVLRAGDEVGLLPPVSGGSGELNEDAQDKRRAGAVRLTREPIDGARLAAEAEVDLTPAQLWLITRLGAGKPSAGLLGALVDALDDDDELEDWPRQTATPKGEQ